MKILNAPSTKTDLPGDQTWNGEQSSKNERFTLIGRSANLDPFYHAYRADLADIALAGQLFAPHYAKPVTRYCGPETTPIRTTPSDTGDILGELMPRQEFAILDITAGWAWGYRLSDHLVGYICEKSLA